MRRRHSRERLCTYLVPIDASLRPDDDLAAYLSTLEVAGCDVVVVDAAPRAEFAERQRILRWVARHVSAWPQHRRASGGVDARRAAIDIDGCEKVIVAGPEVRYTPFEIVEICALLNEHEVVEPQEYLSPLPWWGSIDAGRMLIQRGIFEPNSSPGATYAFRRGAMSRFSLQGAETHRAADLFVRRLPPRLGQWLRQRPRVADDDLLMPLKAAFFFALLPTVLLLATLAGARLAIGYTGAIFVAAIALAARGRAGATSVFPLSACMFAPLWIVERSVSVYWALWQRLAGATRRPQLDRSFENHEQITASGTDR